MLSGRSDIGLSAEGERQALTLGRWFAARDLSALWSSPRRRAVQTAVGIAEATGLPVETAPALDEIDFGAWTGRPFAELADDPAWSRWNEARDVALPPAGEAMTDAALRAEAGMRAIALAASGPVAIVSHADIIKGVAARVLGLSLGRLLAFDVDPASVTTLSVGSWGAKLVSLNEHVV